MLGSFSRKIDHLIPIIRSLHHQNINKIRHALSQLSFILVTRWPNGARSPHGGSMEVSSKHTDLNKFEQTVDASGGQRGVGAGE